MSNTATAEKLERGAETPAAPETDERLGAFRPPAAEDLAIADSASLELHAAVLQAFAEFSLRYAEAPPDPAFPKLAEVRQEALVAVGGMLQEASDPRSLTHALTGLSGQVRSPEALKGLLERLAIVCDFQERVRRGYTIEPGPLAQLDHRRESYELVLRSLAAGHSLEDSAKSALGELFVKQCDAHVQARRLELEKLAEKADIQSDEQAVEGAGKNLKDLVDEKMKEAKDAALTGAKMAGAGLALPFVLGFGLLCKLASAAKEGAEALLSRLGLFEAANGLRDRLGEPEERENNSRWGRGFRLPWLDVGGRAAGGADVEEDEQALGMKGAARRKSQLGMKPLYEGDDHAYDPGGDGALGVDDLLGSLRQRDLVKSKIRTMDYSFNDVLHNTDAWVVEGKDGSLTRLDVFLKGASRRHTSESIPAFKELYPEKLVPGYAYTKLGAPLASGETEVTARIYPGMTLTLPLAPKYAVRRLVFLDRNGDVIQPPEGGWPTRQGLFGSFMLKSPVNAKHIAFVTSAKSAEESAISPELQTKLCNLIPQHKIYSDPEKQIFKKALEQIPSSHERAELMFLAERSSGYVYTMDPFLSRFQKRSGSARPEAISGTRMGICDSFAFYLAVEMRGLGSPALVLSGPTVKGEVFDFNPGHAVAALGTPCGVQEMDLTAYAREDGSVSRWKMSWGERSEAMNDLRDEDLTNKGVFESSENLHYKLKGETPPWSEGDEKPVELGTLGRMLNKLDRRGSARVRERPQIHAGMHNYSLPDKLKAELVGVEALTQKWYLDELFERGREEDGLKPLYRYFRERGSKKGPSPGELKHLPSGFSELQGFNGLSEVLRLTIAALEDDTFPAGARADAIRWAVESSAFPEAKRDPSCTWARWELELTPKQLVGLYSDKALANIGDEDFEKLYANLAENFGECAKSRPVEQQWGQWGVSPNLQIREEAPLRALMSTFERATKELEDRSLALSADKAFELASTALRAGSAIYPQLSEDARPEIGRSVAAIFASLERSAGLADGQLAMRFMREQGHGGAAMLLIFDRDCGGDLVRGRDVSEAIFRELKRSGYNPDDWQPLQIWKKGLGLRADLSPYAAEITPALVETSRAAIRSQVKDEDLRMNWPGEDRPASALAARLSGSPLARLWRSLHSLEGVGALSEPETLARIWPKLPEEHVAEAICSSVKLGSYQDYEISLGEASHVQQYSTRFTNLSSIHRELLGTRAHARSVLDLADFRSPPADEIDKLFGSLRDAHPAAWSKLIARLDGPGEYGRPVRQLLGGLALQALSARIFAGVSPAERYHAALWLGCQQISRSVPAGELKGEMPIFPLPDEAVSALAGAARDGEAASSEALAELGFDRDLHGPLRSLSPRAREAVLFASAFATRDEINWLKTGMSGGGDLPYETNSALLLARADNGRNRLVQLWDSLARHGRDEILHCAFERAKKAVDTYTARDVPKQCAPYTRYLLRENAPITPRSAAGDFEQIRHYRAGDPLNRINWAASARTDKLLVNEYREQEFRPVKVVIDPEWLYESYNADGTSRVELNDLRLEQMFVNLLLAEREQVPVDLVILGRGRPVVLPRLDQNDKLFDPKLLSTISQAISRVPGRMREERALYGAGGPPGYNLCAAGVYAPKGSLLVCGVARDNLLGTEAALASFAKEGSFVHILRAGGPTECASERANEARKERKKAEEEREKEAQSNRPSYSGGRRRRGK